MKNGAELIAEERKRQVEFEGWTPEHDDEHASFSMSTAGAIYALNLYQIKLITKYHNIKLAEEINEISDILWPWDGKWWKPTPDDPVRQLVKAGALIAAEIDRILRQKEVK
ncbi:MAG: hypothetical protein WC389_18820 [Lutibacter sp.]